MMNPVLQRFWASLFPIIGMILFVLIFIIGLFVFSYLLIISAIIGLILFVVAFIRSKISRKPTPPPPSQSTQGRIIEHEEIEKDKE